MRAAQEGRIGEVLFAQCWNHNYAGSPKGMGHPPDADPPRNLDWDMWLGPAPKVPYNSARRNFRVFWDDAGGELTDWCVHLIDIVHWALGVDTPLTVASSGGKWVYEDCLGLRTGLKLQWHGEAERFTNSEEANRLLTREYRAPWRLPGL